MRIKRLELNGFKSFRDRTVIHFNEGITGIVGPNGCGKSNVVDAFFWVLGEVNPRTMRGQAMNDLIFSGSENSPPSGMAEVCLTIETHTALHGPDAPVGASVRDYALHPEVKEISVTRRLFRNGDSEYLLNKVACRLRDIQELFLDTGSGSRGYSIIQQGKIAEIVNAKSEERREIIENVAGIVKYKHRRREANRKIDSTQQNLLRVTDLLSEMEKRRDQMKKQAEKARKYTEWREELQSVELLYSSLRWEKVMNNYGEIQSNITALEEESASLEAKRGVEKTTLTQKKLELTTIEKISEELQAKLLQETKDLSDNENELRYHRKLLDDSRQAISQLEVKKETEKNRVEELQEKIEKENDTYERNRTACEDLTVDRQNQEKETQEEKSKLEQLELKAENQQNDYLKVERDLFQKEERNLSAKQRVKDLEEKIHSLDSTKENLEQNIEKFKDSIAVQEDKFKENKEVLNEKEESIKTKTLEIQENEKELEEIYEKARQIEQEKLQFETKLRSLQDQKRRLEGHGRGVKTVFEDILTNKQEWKDKVEAPLLSMIHIKPGKELAIEAALGASIDLIVSKCPETSIKIIDALREQKGGYVSFANLPQITPIKKRRENLPQEMLAIDCIDTSHQEVFPLLEQLLDGMFFVAEEAKAQKLAASYEECSFITAQGSLYRGTWYLSAGDRKSSESSLLKRDQEIEKLEEKLKGKEIEQKDIQSHLEEKKKFYSAQKKELEKARLDFETISRALMDMEAEILFLTTKLKSIEDRRESITAEARKYTTETETIQKEQLDSTAVDELRRRKEELEALLKETKKDLPSLKEKLAEVQRKLMEMQVKENSAVEYRNASKEKLQTYESSLKHAEEQLSSLSAERETQETQIEESTEQVELLSEKIEERRGSTANIQREYNEIREKLHSLQAEAEASQSSSDEAQKEELKLRDELNEYRIQLERLESEKTSLSQNVRERYEIELEEYLTEPEAQKAVEEFVREYENEEDINKAKQELEDKVMTLRGKIRRLGEVNASAMKEYDELMERFQLLSEQREDLETAIGNLQETIQKINRISKERFFRAFNEVNKQFSSIFPTMFGGGKAELSLTDPTNFLETGVDIMSQPPGKKLQSINLLSGGEKTLAAISLLFAIFLVKPSPFCLLDEVDAPLDDANIGRFNAFLKEMAKKTQFIIITHNKRTMELNDKLYGITMENAGISKMLSIQMT